MLHFPRFRRGRLSGLNEDRICAENDMGGNKQKPELRRAGSSTLSSISLSSLADENSTLEGSSLLPWMEELARKSFQKQGSLFPWQSFNSMCSNTVFFQLKGMTNGFQKSGLPWTGIRCRSLMAGGSGLLYCLPAFVSCTNRLEQVTWVVQAFLSVMADYVHIHHDSAFHGMDRLFATYNTVRILWRSVILLNSCVLILSILPITFFVLANQAKTQLDLQLWQVYHGCWHLTGSIAVSVVVFLIDNCNDKDSSKPSALNPFCKASFSADKS
jgi:hypothetical protein